MEHKQKTFSNFYFISKSNIIGISTVKLTPTDNLVTNIGIVLRYVQYSGHSWEVE